MAQILMVMCRCIYHRSVVILVVRFVLLGQSNYELVELVLCVWAEEFFFQLTFLSKTVPIALEASVCHFALALCD
jgi:hypothetical protein